MNILCTFHIFMYGYVIVFLSVTIFLLFFNQLSFLSFYTFLKFSFIDCYFLAAATLSNTYSLGLNVCLIISFIKHLYSGFYH